MITDKAIAKSALKSLFIHLEERGLLFEIEILKVISKEYGIWRGDRWIRSDEKIILASFLDLAPKDKVASIICKYGLIGEGKVVQSEIEEIKIRLYEQQEMINFLKEAGFKEVRALKAFDKEEAPSSEDEVIVYECKK